MTNKDEVTIKISLDIKQLKKIISDIESGKTTHYDSIISDRKTININTNITNTFYMTETGKIVLRVESDLFNTSFVINPSIEDSSLIINKWLEKVSKLKDEMKMLSK